MTKIFSSLKFVTVVTFFCSAFRVFSEVLVLLGSIGRSQALADAIGCIAGFEELDKTQFREALLE